MKNTGDGGDRRGSFFYFYGFGFVFWESNRGEGKMRSEENGGEREFRG